MVVSAVEKLKALSSIEVMTGLETTREWLAVTAKAYYIAVLVRGGGAAISILLNCKFSLQLIVMTLPGLAWPHNII